MTVTLPPELIQKIKILAIKQNQPLHELVAEALENYLEKVEKEEKPTK